MNKISKLTLAIFAITAATNVSFDMNPQETNAEQIIQNRLKKLKEKKAKDETSWFNKNYIQKLYGDDKPSFFLGDFNTTLSLGIIITGLLNVLIPAPDENSKTTSIKPYIVVCSFLGLVGLGEYAQQRKAKANVRNKKIKTLEKVLAEMKKQVEF